MIIMFVEGFLVTTFHISFLNYFFFMTICVCFFFTGKQAVLVLTCDNPHMAEDVIVEPGLVMIFAHGIE